MTHTALLDSPAVQTHAPTPAPTDGPALRQALAGLVSWQESWHRHCAARLGVRVDGVEVSPVLGVDGEVRFDVRLSGPEPSERYAAVLAAAHEHAPVLDLVTGG
ncbi:hypothetical protein ASG49_04350 [Marmoricola sp. Leaf446]|uniref:hypothetical protein n=1 Tax=Marmoricola sp. Leaf446 TaxID=1736379 RepID=UPI0006FD1E2C|nr:hypothetical protein [Marmoricola sp. Leaf446]KQT94148.1 hypothetical protein ASG49_04350 [Marmoricola sp. Leaf446]